MAILFKRINYLQKNKLLKYPGILYLYNKINQFQNMMQHIHRFANTENVYREKVKIILQYVNRKYLNLCAYKDYEDYSI